MAFATAAMARSLAEQERAVINRVCPSDKALFQEKWDRTWILQANCLDLYESIADTGAGVKDDSGTEKASLRSCVFLTSRNLLTLISFEFRLLGQLSPLIL